MLVKHKLADRPPGEVVLIALSGPARPADCCELVARLFHAGMQTETWVTLFVTGNMGNSYAILTDTGVFGGGAGALSGLQWAQIAVNSQSTHRGNL